MPSKESKSSSLWTRNWFQRRPDGGSSPELQSTKEVYDDRLAWIKSVFKESKELRTNKDITTVYETTQEDLELEINSVTEGAIKELGRAMSRKNSWSVKRDKGARKIGTNIQKFCFKFSSFLKAYVGIIELIKGSDQQFGGLSFGTLSLLLSISVNKENMEEKFGDALEELSLALPRLDVLSDVYPSSKIQEMISDLNAYVIKFARECIVYYTRSSLARIGQVVRDPLHPVNDKLDDIRTKLSEIGKESQTLLAERIKVILEKNEEILAINKKLKQKVEDLNSLVVEMNFRGRDEQSNRDQKHLVSLKSFLKISEKATPNTDVESQRMLHRTAFSDGPRRRDDPAVMTRDLLDGQEVFQQWIINERSLLILSGRNWVGDLHGTTLNWLSPAAVFAVENEMGDDEIKAYYFAQTDFLGNKIAQIRDVLASLIYQLVSQRLECLRSAELLDLFKTSFYDTDWTAINDEDEAFEIGTKCFSKVFSMFSEDDQVILIIDRIDMIDCGKEALTTRETLDFLLSLVRDGHCKLKVLLITDHVWSTTRARGVEEKIEKLKRKWGPLLLEKRDWDQESARLRSLSPAP